MDLPIVNRRVLLHIPNSVQSAYPQILRQVMENGTRSALKTLSKPGLERLVSLDVHENDRPTAELRVRERPKHSTGEYEPIADPLCGFYVWQDGDITDLEHELERRKEYLLHEIDLPEDPMQSYELVLTPADFAAVAQTEFGFQADVYFTLAEIPGEEKPAGALIDELPTSTQNPLGFLRKRIIEVEHALQGASCDPGYAEQVQKCLNGLTAMEAMLARERLSSPNDYMRTGEHFRVDGQSHPSLWIKHAYSKVFFDADAGHAKRKDVLVHNLDIVRTTGD